LTNGGKIGRNNWYSENGQEVLLVQSYASKKSSMIKIKSQGNKRVLPKQKRKNTERKATSPV
jgi:hypothetical protein